MDHLRFDGQVVIVTGAGGALGSEHSKLLASRGAKVVVNDIAQSNGQATVDAIRADGGEAELNTDSIATDSGAAALVQQAIEVHGRLDAIVHNAGIGRPNPIEKASFEDYEFVRAVSMDGAYALAHAAWPHMQASGYGRVLFIVSNAGIQGWPTVSGYGAAKGGSIGLMRCIAIEGASHGINVNCLGNSAFNPKVVNRGSGGTATLDPVLQWRCDVLPPGKVSPVVAWLIHPSCTVTGELFYAGGGHVTRIFQGQTRGYTNRDLTPEDVAEHVPEIMDERGARVFSNAPDAQYDWFQQLVDVGAPPFPGPPGKPALKILP